MHEKKDMIKDEKTKWRGKNEQQIENYDNKITFQIRKKQEAQNLFHLF